MIRDSRNPYRMTFRPTLILLAALAMLSNPVSADFNHDVARNPDNLVGKARLKFMFWNVFDAELHAPDATFDPNEPFALSLSYLRKLKGDEIVEKSIEEIAAQQGKQPGDDAGNGTDDLQRWETQLAAIIPDVTDGTTITGLRDEQGHTLFYRNGEPLGRIDDPAFTQRFFDIWLGESTSDPVFRKRLLGLN